MATAVIHARKTIAAAVNRSERKRMRGKGLKGKATFAFNGESFTGFHVSGKGGTDGRFTGGRFAVRFPFAAQIYKGAVKQSAFNTSGDGGGI